MFENEHRFTLQQETLAKIVSKCYLMRQRRRMTFFNRIVTNIHLFILQQSLVILNFQIFSTKEELNQKLNISFFRCSRNTVFYSHQYMQLSSVANYQHAEQKRKNSLVLCQGFQKHVLVALIWCRSHHR